jgi:hypothetical protein
MKTFLLFFALLLIGCEKEKIESLTDFELNKNKWESLNMDTYTYTFQISCFCLPETTLPKKVEVLKGQINQVNGEPYAGELHWGVLTIPQLFDRIEKAEKNNAVVVEVQYHQEKGYPVSVYIDQDKMIADEEMGYSVTDLID